MLMREILEWHVALLATLTLAAWIHRLQHAQVGGLQHLLTSCLLVLLFSVMQA